MVAKIMPGEYFVSRGDELITTVLGSCVSACIRCSETGIGGMNHFMLPEDGRTAAASHDQATAYRYGGAAMDALIQTIQSMGGKRDALEVKLFGGGRVLDFDNLKVGERNIGFAREYVRRHGLQISAEDLGSEFPRRIVYWPETGRVRVRRLRRMHVSTVTSADQQYRTGQG